MAPDLIAAGIAMLREERIARARLFGPEIAFEDCRWAILLELAHDEPCGRSTSIAGACALSGHPATTALRHLRWLEADGWIERVKAARDLRIFNVRLTPKARAMIARHVARTPMRTRLSTRHMDETIGLGPFALRRADAFRLLLIQGFSREEADAMAFGYGRRVDAPPITLDEVADFFAATGPAVYDTLVADLRARDRSQDGAAAMVEGPMAMGAG